MARPKTQEDVAREYTPTEEEKFLLDTIGKFYQAALAGKNVRHPDAEGWWQLYLTNKDILDAETSAPDNTWGSKIYVNIVRTVIDDINAIMIQLPMEMNVRGTEVSDEMPAKIHEAIIKNICYRQRLEKKRRIANQIRSIEGCVFYKVIWDDELADGRGDVSIEVVSPKHIFIDPDATELNPPDCNAQYILHVRQVPLGKIRALYPEKGKYVSLGKDIGVAGIVEGEYREPHEAEALTKPVLLVEAWWMSDETERIAPEDFAREAEEEGLLLPDKEAIGEDILLMEESGVRIPGFEEEAVLRAKEIRREERLIKKDRPKYPYGRKTVVAGGVVLEDKPNKQKYFPFVAVPNVPVEGRIIGSSEVEFLQPVQDEINKILRRTSDVLRLTANPRLIVDADSGIDVSQITNQPGEIYVRRPGSGFVWSVPPSIPPYVFSFLNMLLALHDVISGVHDVVQGRRPRGIGAGIAIAQLQEAAQVRINDKIKTERESLIVVGELILDLIQQGYTDERKLRIVGDLGQHVAELAVRMDPMLQQAMGFGVEQGIDQTIYLRFIGARLEGEFDIVIDPGLGLPTSKAERARQAEILFQMGVIDRQALLDIIEFPNRYQILQRMGQMALAQQMAMMPPEQVALPPPAGGEVTPPELPMPEEGPMDVLEGLREQIAQEGR